MEKQARRKRARADTKSLADWKIDVARALVAGVLTVGGIALLDLPDGITGQVIAVALFVAGVVLVLGIEYAWNYVMADGRIAMEEAARLGKANAELRAKHEELEGALQAEEQRSELLGQRLAQVQKELAVSQAQYKVFRDFDLGKS
jgi:hypothetical protein